MPHISTRMLLAACAGAFLFWASNFGTRFMIVEWGSLLCWVILISVIAERALLLIARKPISVILAIVIGLGLVGFFRPTQADAPSVPTNVKPEEALKAPGVMKTPEPTPAAPAASVPDNPRIFVSDSVREILAPFKKDITEYQAAQLFAAYKGKWVRLTATIGQISMWDSDGTVHVVGVDDTRRDRLLFSMTFSRKQSESITHLKIGDSISAACKMGSLYGTNGGMILNDCEIAKP